MTWPLIILFVFWACLLGTVALCFGDAAVDCVRDAVRQWRYGRDDDPFVEREGDWAASHAACDCEDCRSFADDFATIAAELAGDFAHLDIRRLEALYLVIPEGTK